MCPYTAPELISQTVSPLLFSDTTVKADTFSIGVLSLSLQMLFLRLLCNLTETDFSEFDKLNLTKNLSDYSKRLYEIVKFGERNNFQKELAIIIQTIGMDPNQRLSPDKLYAQIQNDYLYDCFDAATTD